MADFNLAMTVLRDPVLRTRMSALQGGAAAGAFTHLCGILATRGLISAEDIQEIWAGILDDLDPSDSDDPALQLAHSNYEDFLASLQSSLTHQAGGTETRE